MTDIRELLALMKELLAVVDVRTGVPKFPARATEIIKEVSAYAKKHRDCTEYVKEAEASWGEEVKPEEIWAALMREMIYAPSPVNMYASFIGHMPALEKALAAQRRCRVCGCTDDNACVPNSCYWVGPDLCSECAKIKEGGA